MTADLIDSAGKRMEIRRGTSPTHTFAITDKATTLAKNLTGATEATFSIAASRAATTRDLQLILNAGVTHDGTGGNVSVAFSKPQTEALPVGRRWGELWITDSAGRRDMPAAGWLWVHDTLINL